MLFNKLFKILIILYYMFVKAPRAHSARLKAGQSSCYRPSAREDVVSCCIQDTPSSRAALGRPAELGIQNEKLAATIVADNRLRNIIKNYIIRAIRI